MATRSVQDRRATITGTGETDATTDTDLRAALSEARVIGVVGASANPDRPSHRVGWYLARQGYRVIGVNPGLAGQDLFGAPVAARIADLPAETDLLDLFRRPEDVPVAVDAALAHLPALRTVWMQLGIRHAGAAAAARAQGVRVIEDRCPAIEIPRLFPKGGTLGVS